MKKPNPVANLRRRIVEAAAAHPELIIKRSVYCERVKKGVGRGKCKVCALTVLAIHEGKATLKQVLSAGRHGEDMGEWLASKLSMTAQQANDIIEGWDSVSVHGSTGTSESVLCRAARLAYLDIFGKAA